MARKSKEIAVGGISAGACLVIMFLTGLMPFATYALPSLAGFALIPVVVEMGTSTALVVYAATSLLSILIVPDKEAAIMFIAFLGYYPILKGYLQKIKPIALQWFIKFAIFNLSVITAYTVVIKIFRMTEVLESSGFLGSYFLLVMLIFGNFTFVLYDFAVKNLYTLYFVRFRKKFLKK